MARKEEKGKEEGSEAEEKRLVKSKSYKEDAAEVVEEVVDARDAHHNCGVHVGAARRIQEGVQEVFQ